MKSFVKWLLNSLVIDPLIMLFIWNVIIVAMFSTGKTTFTTCLILSIIVNIFYSGIKSNYN